MNCPRLCIAFALAMLAAAAQAEDSTVLADLASRIDYGYYTREPSVIVAASDQLSELGEKDQTVRYLRAYASFRLGLLASRGASSEVAPENRTAL
jgi:HAMP domain-containing protein